MPNQHTKRRTAEAGNLREYRPPAPDGRIEGLRVIRWQQYHYEAVWTVNGRRFSMFFDPLVMEPKGGEISWRYADGPTTKGGRWLANYSAAAKMVPTVLRQITREGLITAADEDYMREVASPEGMLHRKSAREANALLMFSALQTIQTLAGFGRRKGESFGLNERERMEILTLATATVSAVNTWREGDK